MAPKSPIKHDQDQSVRARQRHSSSENRRPLSDPVHSENHAEIFLADDNESLLSTINGDLPPPPYGQIYGQINAEQDGNGASAQVTDDGRVNIRVNQLNRRLSQIFIPALRPSQEDQNTTGAIAGQAKINASEAESARSPPRLNVVIHVVGSRGDVQPFIALGKVLKTTYGHRVRLATHPVFKDFVEQSGLEFFSIGGDPARLMASMVKNPSLIPGIRSIANGDVSQRRRDVAEYIQGCWRSCYLPGDGLRLNEPQEKPLKDSTGTAVDPSTMVKPFVADCIIANPPSFAHIHCAEKLGIPLHIMFTMPYSPTQDFPHPLANIQATNADAQITNYISYVMIEVLSWQGLGSIINRFRAKCLSLDPVSLIWAPGMLQRLKIPHTYCWSPALIPKPKDWGPHISIAGFYMLDLASDYTPTDDLKRFLDAGPPPIYIGFGSIVLEDPDAMTKMIFQAVRKTGQRALISKGWGGLNAEEIGVPDNVLMLGNVPHDWLFQHVSCVIHHGGAGTTAAGISAGRPTFVVPFFGDQLFWGSMIARAGAGPEPVPHKQLTADRLAGAIEFCLRAETLECAARLARTIATEKGTMSGAHAFHQQLKVDDLRCLLAPSRAATWRVKRSQVKLSAFAACTLVNAKLLDFKDLKLFRPREYETDEGAWDPLSGSAAAIFGAIGSISSGLASIPTETSRAVQLPFQTRQKRAANSTDPKSGVGSSTAYDSTGDRQSTSESQAKSFADQTSTSREKDMMQRTGAHGSKGFGKMVRSTAESPMNMAVEITKGFHNLPKMWGDDTVRPQQQVTDFTSGIKAIGKEFGFGFYDGVSGLVTQPYQGARKEGAGGFFKGIGKGVGGFVAKPGAALFGIPAYFMKGIQKETQKLFGGNVTSHIVASRIAQGYEEWSQSTEAEKQAVVEKWRLVQKLLKKKGKPEDMLSDMLHVEPLSSVTGEGTSHASSPIPAHDPAFPLARATESNPTEQAASFSQPQIGGQETATTVDQQLLLDQIRQELLRSQAEARRHAEDAAAYERQLAQLLNSADSSHAHHNLHNDPLTDSDPESVVRLNDEQDEEFDRNVRRAEKRVGNQ